MSKTVDVWNHNLKEQIEAIIDLLDDYPCISMNARYPRVIAKPRSNSSDKTQETYQVMRCNVDLMKVIQIGLTFSNEEGQLPAGKSTWQFNFKYALGSEMYSAESLSFLEKTGIRFADHEEKGIRHEEFGELLLISGMVLSQKVKWVSFKGHMSYGYLLKLLTSSRLPEDENEFMQEMRLYFPLAYDLKYILVRENQIPDTHRLWDLAVRLSKVDRLGPRNHAGTESLLTALVYTRMQTGHYGDSLLDHTVYCGKLAGLN